MIDLKHENDLATLRTNGRKLNESRQVSFELGTMKNTNGSAIYTIGNTKVAAFIQGPHQVCSSQFLMNIDHLKRSRPDSWRDPEPTKGNP